MVAVENGGYVTPALVAPYGVPAIELRKMASRDTLQSAGHGVYRVPSLPIEQYDEFILARLWAAGRGVISHDSALLVHELCDINPTTVHITIPTTYRISRSGRDRYTIHHADLTADEAMRLDSVTVTTIRRTLDDALGVVATSLFRQAADTARERGAISHEEHNRLLHQLEAGYVR